MAATDGYTAAYRNKYRRLSVRRFEQQPVEEDAHPLLRVVLQLLVADQRVKHLSSRALPNVLLAGAISARKASASMESISSIDSVCRIRKAFVSMVSISSIDSFCRVRKALVSTVSISSIDSFCRVRKAFVSM